MRGIELSEWEKLAYVEVHTIQYMKVDEKLALVVNAIKSPNTWWLTKLLFWFTSLTKFTLAHFLGKGELVH